jgi:hypothetical protein
MKIDSPFRKPGLNLTNIFRYMMEAGYNPSYEHTHIQFDLEGNLAVVECEDGIASVKIFFSIDQEQYGLFIEASNSTMLKTYIVKPAVLDDMQNIVFSFEFLCADIRDFKKHFPRSLDYLTDALSVHKAEMRRLVYANGLMTKKVPETDETVTGTVRKILS